MISKQTLDMIDGFGKECEDAEENMHKSQKDFQRVASNLETVKAQLVTIQETSSKPVMDKKFKSMPVRDEEAGDNDRPDRLGELAKLEFQLEKIVFVEADLTL